MNKFENMGVKLKKNMHAYKMIKKECYLESLNLESVY